jgi:hypothetical protein
MDTTMRQDSDLRKLAVRKVGWFTELLIFPPKKSPNMATQQKILRRGALLDEES